MRMVCTRFWFLSVCVLSVASGQSSSCLSADETTPATRTIHFVLEDEPYIADAQGEDLHYAAVVRGFALLLFSDNRQGTGAPIPLDVNGIFAMARLDQSPAGSRVRKLMNGANSSVPHPFRSKLIEDYDPRLAPGGMHTLFHKYLPNAITMLENRGNPYAENDVRYSWRHFVQAQDARPPLQEYALLAPSVDEAKQFAADFLHVYDQGFVPWLKKLLEADRSNLVKSRDKAQSELNAINKKLAVLSREVKDVEPLDEKAISDLKVKRTLLKVELAGVKARLSSIEEKLKPMGSETPAATRGKLADLKISAEIDLASLAAQQKVLDELILGQSRLAEMHQLGAVRPQYANQTKAAEEGLPRCDEILADLKSFQLVDDTVVIRPLRFHAK